MGGINALEARRRILLNTPHIETASGSIATFNTDMVGKLKECKIYYEPVQEGEGDPSPDNVRPITGWTGCEVTRCGKNFLKLPRSVDVGSSGLNFNGWNKSNLSNDAYSAFNNYYNVSFEFINNSGVSVAKANRSNGQGLDLPCSIKGGELNYSFSYSTSGDRPRLGRALFNKDGELINYINNTGAGKVVFSESVSWCVYRFAPWDANSTATYNNIQLELGDTATDFEPYQGTTISIDWTDEAGTVYGGYVDLVKGEVVAEWVSLSITGDYIIADWSGADANRDSLGVYCNAYNWERVYQLPIPVDGGAQMFDYCYIKPVYSTDNKWAAQFLFIGAFSRFEMRIPKDVLETENLAGAKKYLNAHPLQAVYKTTPIHYPIDPITLKTLRGTNNIFANTNGNAEVKFYTH